jgi:hypothetical protein
MSEPRKRATRPPATQDPMRYASPARRREAEKTTSLTSALRAIRRVAKSHGRGSADALLKMFRTELGVHG